MSLFRRKENPVPIHVGDYVREPDFGDVGRVSGVSTGGQYPYIVQFSADSGSRKLYPAGALTLLSHRAPGGRFFAVRQEWPGLHLDDPVRDVATGQKGIVIDLIGQSDVRVILFGDNGEMEFQERDKRHFEKTQERPEWIIAICRFCRTTTPAAIKYVAGLPAVQCQNSECNAMGPVRSTTKEAIAAWNGGVGCNQPSADGQ